MKVYPYWISVEEQAQIEPPPIPLVKKEPDEVNDYDIVNINMHQNPSDADSETYKLKIVAFEHSQLEEFLQTMNNFKREVDGKVNTMASGKINYI